MSADAWQPRPPGQWVPVVLVDADAPDYGSQRAVPQSVRVALWGVPELIDQVFAFHMRGSIIEVRTRRTLDPDWGSRPARSSVASEPPTLGSELAFVDANFDACVSRPQTGSVTLISADDDDYESVTVPVSRRVPPDPVSRIGYVVMDLRQTTAAIDYVGITIKAASHAGAAAWAEPPTDTVKLADEDGIVNETPDRARLRRIVGPVAMRREVLQAALAAGEPKTLGELVLAIEAAGTRVRLLSEPGGV